MSMMSKSSKIGFGRQSRAGIDIPRRSSGEANGMHAVIGPTLVGIALAGQEPQRVTSSHSAFVQFATTGALPNAAGLGN